MENKEALKAAFDEFNNKPSETVPEILDKYFEHVAQTGETLFEWDQLKLALRHKMDQALKLFQEQVPMDSLLPTPNVENVKFTEMRERLINALDAFTGAPFTIQRLCELITSPRKHYLRTDKFMRGLEKNLMIVSAVDPFGKKIVSESKSRPYVNGLDANGVMPSEFTSPEKKDSPFFPPAPMNSPATSSWFSSVTNSPTVVQSPWQQAGAGDASNRKVHSSWIENEADDVGNGPPEKRCRLSSDNDLPSPESSVEKNDDKKLTRSCFETAIGGTEINRALFDSEFSGSKYRITGSAVEKQPSESDLILTDSKTRNYSDSENEFSTAMDMETTKTVSDSEASVALSTVSSVTTLISSSSTDLDNEHTVNSSGTGANVVKCADDGKSDVVQASSENNEASVCRNFGEIEALTRNCSMEQKEISADSSHSTEECNDISVESSIRKHDDLRDSRDSQGFDMCTELEEPELDSSTSDKLSHEEVSSSSESTKNSINLDANLEGTDKLSSSCNSQSDMTESSKISTAFQNITPRESKIETESSQDSSLLQSSEQTITESETLKPDLDETEVVSGSDSVQVSQQCSESECNSSDMMESVSGIAAESEPTSSKPEAAGISSQHNEEPMETN